MEVVKRPRSENAPSRYRIMFAQEKRTADSNGGAGFMDSVIMTTTSQER